MALNRVALADLRAEWRQAAGRASDDFLVFECPICKSKRSHLVVVATRKPSPLPGGPVWRVDGSREIAKVTLRPTINLSVPIRLPDGTTIPSTCSFHGRIRNGHVEWGS